jgi:hypothetical protein
MVNLLETNRGDGRVHFRFLLVAMPQMTCVVECIHGFPEPILL